MTLRYYSHGRLADALGPHREALLLQSDDRPEYVLLAWGR